jgi:predicted dehydrogenase
LIVGPSLVSLSISIHLRGWVMHTFRFGPLLVCFLSMTIIGPALASDPPTRRIGIIGLDTSHAIAFTKEFNQDSAESPSGDLRVVAAFPFGSHDIESSASRIPKYTEQIRELGVKIVDSVDALLEQVDFILLETNDGRLHLEQSLQVFRAGKPVFIDKPCGSNLGEVIAIYRAAEHFGVPMFSSSSLRFSAGVQSIRSGESGEVLGCDAYSPCALEPTHVDLFWYGIHGVETLYTCISTGCESVCHVSTSDQELAVGRWAGGRIGTFRGMRVGKRGYGGTVFTDRGISSVGKFDGYRPLVLAIADFFRSGRPPVDPAETVELYAFMQAAADSKAAGGRPVLISDVMSRGERDASRLLDGKLKAR